MKGDKRGEQMKPNVKPGSELLSLAVGVFENKAAAMNWWNSPIVALGGQKPSALCVTAKGRQQVRHVLMRIEHGVFS